MKKFLYAVLGLMLVQMQANALDIVYPTKEYSKINSPSTFIVGSTKPNDRLFINDREIDVHKSGAFAQAVKLQNGVNEFRVYSGNVEKTYTIERPYVGGGNWKPAQIVDFECPKIMEITREGAPVRTTPVQSGINRLAHYHRGMLLKVDGEKGDMYRVVLANNQKVWVAKSDVKRKLVNYDRAFLYDYRERETENNYIYEFALSKQTPYSITEGETMTLKIYNVGGNDNNIATFNIKLNQMLMGYDIRYKGDTLVLSIKKEPNLSRKHPLKNVRIVVDAGHGGKELGAVGCCRNYEKDFNLSIAKYLEKELRSMGATVYMTRSYDKYVSLNDRVRYTNDKEAQIFVSIHANSLPDSINPMTRRGSSVFYYYDEAKPLSDAIMNSVANKMPVNNEGVKQASFAVVRNTSAVSVLVETAYVINPYDNELLMTDKFRQDYAKAVADGIKNYVWQSSRIKMAWLSRNKIKCEKIS